MDQIFQDDVFRHKELAGAHGYNSTTHKFSAKEAKLPSRLFSLLGLYHDPNEDPSAVFFPKKSATAAYKLFSCIECTAVESKTEQLCVQIAEYLLILAEYNNSIYKRRNAYPYSEELMDVLRAYVELEYETLYGAYSFVNLARESGEIFEGETRLCREEKVQKRVLERLNHMLPCCYDYSNNFHHGLQPFNVILSRDMQVFQVLKSVKLKYQNKGFIKNAMKEIIDNNAEMSAIINRKLKNGELNSIRERWTDNDIAFMTDRECHPCLTKSIPEDYYDCLKLYNIERPLDFEINLDDGLLNELVTDTKEIKCTEFDEDQFYEEMRNSVNYDSADAALTARQFIQPPPMVSDQYVHTEIKTEMQDDDDEDSGSSAQDKSTSGSENTSSSANGTNKITVKDASNDSLSMKITSTTKGSSRRNCKIKRSGPKEKIVGRIIVSDDDDIVFTVPTIESKSDDDDVNIVEPENEITKATDEQKEIDLSPLAVLAAEAVVQAKIQVDSSEIIEPVKVISEMYGQSDTSSLIDQENISKVDDQNDIEILDNTPQSVLEPCLEEDSSRIKDHSTPDIQSSISVPFTDMEVELEEIVMDVQATEEIVTEVQPPEEIVPDVQATTDTETESTSNLDISFAESEPDFIDTLNEIPSAESSLATSDKPIAISNDFKSSSELIVSVEIPTEIEIEVRSSTETEDVPKLFEKAVEISQQSIVPLETVVTDSKAQKDISLIEDCSNVSRIVPNFVSEVSKITEIEHQTEQERMATDLPIMAEQTDKPEPTKIESLPIPQVINITNSQKDMPLIGNESEAIVTTPISANSVNTPSFDIPQLPVVPPSTVNESNDTLVTDSDLNISIPMQVDSSDVILPTQSDAHATAVPITTVATKTNVIQTVSKPKMANMKETNENKIVKRSDQVQTITEGTSVITALFAAQQDVSIACERDSKNDTLNDVADGQLVLPSRSRVRSAEAVKDRSGSEIIRDTKQLTSTAQEITKNADDSIIPLKTTESVIIARSDSKVTNTRNKTNICSDSVKVENLLLPSEIPDVDTGSISPRKPVSMKIRSRVEFQTNVNNIRKPIPSQDEISKLSPPPHSNKSVQLSTDTHITKNNDELLSLAKKHPEKVVNCNDNISPPYLKEEGAVSSKATDIRVDRTSIGGYKSKVDGPRRYMRTKAARKQGVETIGSPHISSTNTVTQNVPVTKKNTTEIAPVNAARNEQTSRDPLVCGILPEKTSDGKDDDKDQEEETILRNAGFNVINSSQHNISNDFSCELQDPEQETILRNAGLNVNNSSQHISNDFPCELTVLLDMEIQTEQVPSTKETHGVNEIADQTNKGADIDQTEDGGYAQDENQHEHDGRIGHKMGNKVLSIDGNMHKSIMCCLGFQKESHMWRTNDCNSGFCNRALQGQTYKNENADNVEGEEDVETLLLSGTVRSREVVDDIRDLDTQQLFEVEPEHCDESMSANDCKSVVIHNKNIKVRVMDKADINNMVMHPVDLSVTQQAGTEQHSNAGRLDPLIEINENTVEELLQVSSNTQNEVFDMEQSMDTNIEIIEAVVTSAAVEKSREIHNEVDVSSFQEINESAITNSSEIKEPITKVVVEHISNTNLYDTIKSRDSSNKSYAHFYTSDEPEQRNKKKYKKGKKKPVSLGAASTHSTTKSPSQGLANPPSPSVTSSSNAFFTKSSGTNSEEVVTTKLSKPNGKSNTKKVHSESGTTNNETSSKSNPTFDRLLTEYRDRQSNPSSSPTPSKPASPMHHHPSPEVKKVNNTQKIYDTNSEEASKPLKRGVASIGSNTSRGSDSFPPNSRSSTKKSSNSRSPSQGTSTSPHLIISSPNVRSPISSHSDSSQGSTKVNRRGGGSLEQASSSAPPKSSSQSTINMPRSSTKKVGGNINSVTERLQEHATRNQELKNLPQVLHSPAYDSDYEQQNKQERSRRVAQTSNQRRPIQQNHPVINNIPTILNNSNAAMTPQFMYYPTKQSQYLGLGLQPAAQNSEFKPWETHVHNVPSHVPPSFMYGDGSTMGQPTTHNHPGNRFGHQVNTDDNSGTIQSPRKLVYSPSYINTAGGVVQPPLPNHAGNRNPPKKPEKQNREMYRNMLPGVFTIDGLPGFWNKDRD